MKAFLVVTARHEHETTPTPEQPKPEPEPELKGINPKPSELSTQSTRSSNLNLLIYKKMRMSEVH